MFKKPDVIFGTTLVGTNIATVTISTLGNPLYRSVREKRRFYFGVVLTPVLLILGEVVPKSIYQQKADTLVSHIIIMACDFSLYLFYPVIFISAGWLALWHASLAAVRFRRICLSPGRSCGCCWIFRSRHPIPRKSTKSEFAELSVLAIPPWGGDDSARRCDWLQSVARYERGDPHCSMGYGYNRLPVYQGNITNVKGF